MQQREIKDVSNVRIKQIDISYNIFHYNWISFLLTLDFCEISERIFSGTTPCISRPHIGDSFCFNNPLLYRKPVCVRIAIASGEKMEKRKIWQFWNWESCSRSSRVTQVAAAAAIGGGGEQTVKCKHRPHWLFMIIHRERRRGCQGALRAADNFLISSPRLPFFTPSLSSKCPFAGTPGLPLMCPRDADILSSTSAENKWR